MSSSQDYSPHRLELLQQIAVNPNIPSPPSVILRVLQEASTPDCTISDLCKIIEMDPGLSGKILRIVNSALFGLSRPATSIHRALSVVGVNSARLLVLAISMPEMHQKSKLDARIKQRYWKASIAGAIVARELGRRLRSSDPEDDMAAGLLCDIGELVLHQLFPDGEEIVGKQPDDVMVNAQCELERTHFGLDHAEVSAFLLDRWRLPAVMTEAIRCHHHPADGKYTTPKAESRAYMLLFATRSAQLLLYPDQPSVLNELHGLANERYAMSVTDVREFLVPLSQKAADFAALLQVDMGDGLDFQNVLSRAGNELVQLAMTTSLDNQQALELTRRAETEAQRWRQEAVFDPLTRVFNRRFLERKLQEMFEKTKRDDLPFGLLFIDLDGFKPLNDRYGHAFGDQVLHRLAQCLQRTARYGDTVARYGGDEFCIVSESMESTGALAMGQRVLQVIQDLVVRDGSYEGRVGASIGAACCRSAADWTSAADVLAGADYAMYRAKAQGGNRVVVVGARTEIGAINQPPTAKSHREFVL